ncbi:MAG: DEAD/DEAH box helicase family protein [Actinobacteria bacterium]|nr:DEAD/DEAH box helicase family protein [Cyanobacteriota bacterium]MCL5770792.1 DEAD/DEAH box helicase family protein [Actinomycetota bacterium]
MNLNEATSTDLKIINELQKIGWKPGDTLLYQPEYKLTEDQQKEFSGHKSIKPDVVLQDLHGNVLAVFENKLENEKKALTKLRTLYWRVLKPRFLYACSSERILFYDTCWRGLEAGDFRRVDGFMTLEEMLLKIEQEKQKNLQREIIIDKAIIGGYDPVVGKERYFQTECVQTLVEKYKQGKQKMLVHMATGLGKTRIAVAFTKALLQYGLAKRVLFVVDRIILAEQARNEGFSLINKDFHCAWVKSSNYKQYRNYNIHIVVIDTLENIFQEIPNTFYDLIIVDECHRSININRKLIFDHFLCPRVGLTATPKKAILAKDAKDISEEDLEILDTYKLFGCETNEPDYQFDLSHGIDEGFLAPYKVLEIKTQLTKEAEEKGIEFDYVFDPDTRKKIELDKTKKIWLEQLEKKYLSEERALRIAEEIKKNTQYGEKMILFGASQAHCIILADAINKVFSDNGEIAPKYAEAIISDNSNINDTLKEWFKNPNRKPYIVASVDIMTTGVDIPCVRFIGFVTLTKSVGKYIQMLGRGTRLDPKSGKFSFTILDFVGLCKKMEDNGKGTLKPNIKIVKESKNILKGWAEKIGETPINWVFIPNPDPANMIQRVWVHERGIKIIDNIPIEEAKKLFEEEAQKITRDDILSLQQKVKENPKYEPTDSDLEIIKEWAKNPEIYLDEEQLKRIYNYPQGNIWDFFLHATGVKSIPTLEERIEKGFEEFIKAYNFTNDEQVRILERIKNILAKNYINNKRLSSNDIFSSPIYEQIVGRKEELDKVFQNRFSEILKYLEESIKI